MTNNLQDRFEKEFPLKGPLITDERILKFILSEVEQAKKDLINQLLSEAPEDITYIKEYTEGFNECNQEWRTLLESKLK